MLRHQTFRLITLGRVGLIAPDGSEDQSLAKRRRKLALLTVPASAGRPLARTVLAEMFWGDQNEQRARHSLSDALSHLRRVLGRQAIASRQTDVWISATAGLSVDATELTIASAARDAQRVTELYTGPFLDGVYVDGSVTFEHWLARERDRLERLFIAACESRCLALARARAWDDCAALAARWLGIAPLSVDAALYRLSALKSPGTRDACARALAAYDQLARRLRDEYELAPDRRVTSLAADIVERLRSDGTVHAAPAVASAFAEPSAAPPNAAEREAPARRRPSRWLVPVSALGIALLLAAFATRHALARSLADRAPADVAPVIAVAPLQILDADRESAWLGGGLAQPLARGDTMYVLDVSVHDVASGRVIRLCTVTAQPVRARLAQP